MSLSPGDYGVAILGMSLGMAIAIVFAFALSKTKWIKIQDENGNMNYLSCLVIALTFGILCIISTHYFSISYNGYFVNCRDFPAFLGGLLGGPIGGLGAGIIGGVERFTNGGATAIPCMLGTILSGLAGGLIWWFAGKKFPKLWIAVVGMCLMEIVHILLVFAISDPLSVGPEIAKTIGIPMIVSNTLGMVVFVYVYDKFMDKKDES